jgi:hypothetical protein
MSFQRRVGTGVDRNRGSLPFHQIGNDDRPLRILVPLPAGEALWISWTLKPGLRVAGHTRDDIAVRVAPVTDSITRWNFWSADVLETPNVASDIDENAFAPIRTKKQIEKDHLLFEVFGESGDVLNRIAIVIATPALYARLSGSPAPLPSVPSDAYGGWRLP